MDLLDRYLEAVRKHLPWQRQDDIIAELRANLESQLEEKEEALGRPLTQDEAEEWLKQLGAPIQVAAGYQTHQYLIGPNLFPTYRYVIKLACSWATIIYAIVTVVQVFATQNPNTNALLEALLRLPFVLVNTAAWVTVVFAAIEYAVAHQYLKLPAMCAPSPGWNPSSWTPGTLTPLGAATASGKKPRSYAQAVAEFVFGILFLGWLLLVPHHPWLLMGPGAVVLDVLPYRFAPVWVPIFWSLVALNILQLAWSAQNLARGTWREPHPVARFVFKLIGLVPVILLLNAKDHITVELKHPALDAAHYAAPLNTINLSILRSFQVITAIVVLQLVWDLWQLVRDDYRKRAAAMQ
jgi:hypothetical protein